MTDRDLKNITIAIISDRFTFESFISECNLIYLEPHNWRQILRKSNPDIFLCESAWEGIDPVTRSWHHKIAWFKEEKIRTLKRIIKYCHRKKIPTIFYNKEDPIHFEKFLPAAKLFDYVFTTAEEQIDYYKAVGIENIFVTTFSVQPRNFNPIKKYERTEEVIFAGSYFNDKPERQRDQEIIFDKVINSDKKLVFYNRQSESKYPVYNVPEKYKSYVRPALDYSDIDKAYKSSKYAININTVKNSETMFSRRVYELLGSGTYVFSNESNGMDRLFGDIVQIVKKDEPLDFPDEQKYRRAVLQGVRTVLTKHTYEIRLKEILSILGYTVPHIVKNPITVIIVSEESNIESIPAVSPLSNQSYPSIDILVVKNIKQIEKIKSPYFMFANEKTIYNRHYIMDMMLSYKYLPDDTLIVRNPNDQFQFIDILEVQSTNTIFPCKYLTKIISTESEKVIVRGCHVYSVPMEQF